MNELSFAKKIDVPGEHWDRLFAPSACLVMITTVDGQGRINAASFGTCVRVCHDPVFIAFTVGATKDTCSNVMSTGEFVVNVPPFEKEILEKVRVCGLEFPPGVNELEKAGLTALPSRIAKRRASPNAKAISSAKWNGPGNGCTGSWWSGKWLRRRSTRAASTPTAILCGRNSSRRTTAATNTRTVLSPLIKRWTSIWFIRDRSDLGQCLRNARPPSRMLRNPAS